jgi:hypothetical protein
MAQVRGSTLLNWSLVLTVDSDVDVPLSESRVNYNWGPIMKTINEDPYSFFSGGGWSFLTGPGDASDQETEVSEVDSEYSEEGEVSESEPSESDFSGSIVSDEDSDMGSAEDDEGEDWDEMERKAAKCKGFSSSLLAILIFFIFQPTRRSWRMAKATDLTRMIRLGGRSPYKRTVRHLAAKANGDHHENPLRPHDLKCIVFSCNHFSILFSLLKM